MKIFRLACIIFLAVGMSGCSPVPMKPNGSGVVAVDQKADLTLSPLEAAEAKVAEIDKLVAAQKMFSYDLPKASDVIDKREASGFLDATKTGKISRLEVGMGELNEEYYFDKGSLLFVRVTTQFTVDGKANKQVREMHFQDGKLVVHLKDGKLVENASANTFVEEETVSDSNFLFSDFLNQKQMSEG